MVRAFQGATMALKYARCAGRRRACRADARRRLRSRAARRPRAGGGGNLHGPGRGRRRPDPGWRRHQGNARARDGERASSSGADPLPIVQRVFETIGFGKVSTSGADALAPRLPAAGRWHHDEPRAADRGRQGGRARARRRLRRSRSRARRSPSAAKGCRRRSSWASTSRGGPGRLTDHDALIGRTLARILAGGDRPHAGTVTEQELLDLEREAFLSLCGQRKTQERIAHTLKTGKTLRN